MGEAVGWRWGRGPRGIGGVDPAGSGRRADGSGRGGRRAGPRVPSRPRRGHLQRREGEAVGWRWGRGPRGIGGVVRTEAGAEGGTEGPVAASARPPPTEGGGGGRVEVGSRTPRDRVVDPAGSGRRADGSGRGGKGAGPRVPSRPRRGHLQRREGEAVGWRWGRGPRGIGSSTPRDRGRRADGSGRGGKGAGPRVPSRLGEATSNGGGPGGVGPLRGGGSSARRSPLCPGRRAGRVRWSRPWRGGGGGRVRSRLRSVS
jgi:hypothetical protein